MSRSIPEHKIDEVREATDVVDLVSGYVTLKKSGRNYFGLCPFHVEKTPSFSVNPEKQIFHCFGCGAGGNVYTFLMRHEGISFPESVKVLAQRAGIQIEFDERDESEIKENEALYYVNEFAAKFYQQVLMSAEGKPALDYLLKRGYQLPDIEKYGLGFAPAGWDKLLEVAKKETFDEELLARAGLVLKKESGGYYDRFRERVMFPIWNLSGRIIAFGGRKLSEKDDSPKYVNSPETPIYEKGKMLYGLYQNRDEIRKTDQAIFVEGYTDLMSLAASGIQNVVATLGTALTENQAQLIHRYTKNIVLLYDSDTAGAAATLRGADVLLEGALEVFIATLPEGHDPDSFVKEHSADGVTALVQKALHLFDYKLQQISISTAEKRTELIRSVLISLASIKDKLQRNILLNKISEKLAIDEKVLWAELDSILFSKRQGQVRRSKIGQQLADLGKISRLSKTELALEDLVRILIQDWELAEFIFVNLDLKSLAEYRLAPVLSYLKNRFKADKRLLESELINHFHDVDISAFIIRALHEKVEDVDLQLWALDCLLSIQIERLDRKLKEVREQLRQAQQEGRSVTKLLQLCMELEKQRSQLQQKDFLKEDKKT
ncbi:MAG: DNA primase [bacterium]